MNEMNIELMNNETRIFAIVVTQPKRNNDVKSMISTLKDMYNITDRIIVFVESDNIEAFQTLNSIETVIIPDECDNSTKRKNFVLDTMKNSSFTGFLHMFEDNVVFFKDPHEYIATVEKTMSFLDYDVYFSTVTDPCNYLFTKFNPRITLDIDDPKLLERGISKAISFTSHSNTTYVIYNYAAFQTSDVLKFNESFNIAMFNIIEFLARRKSSKKAGQLYFMNQYLSIKEEIGVYGSIDDLTNKISNDELKKEDAIFKSMNINYAPDNSIDIVLDALYAKILQKTT